MAEYRLSPRAQRDLDGIFDYTVTQWGLPQALRYTDLIEAACARWPKRHCNPRTALRSIQVSRRHSSSSPNLALL
jgi:plasmid stabilization system protein ParE